MIGFDEEALICDLAETYQIYDYESLPVRTVAILAAGLGPNSRINIKLSGLKCSPDTFLLANILDGLNTLIWFQTKDGQKGRNRPKSVAQTYIVQDETEKQNDEIASFETGEEFERARNRILNKLRGG